MPASPNAVNGGSTQIDLTWTAASDNSTAVGALIYEICQSSSAGGCATFTASYVTAAGATSYNVGGLNPSTTYYFRIRARDTANNAGIETAEISATTAAPGIVNTPTYSPVAGTFASTQLVSISSTTPGSTICYTTDGVTTPTCNATPTCTAGTTYAAAFNVTVTTTLKAIACKNGSTNSSVANGVFTIDSTPPTVSGVTSSTTNGSLAPGSTISIQVSFSEVVNVTGTPQLTLATGSPATTAVNYVSGSGTSVLNFDYLIASGNFSADLDYANTTALSLNGGTIQDAAGNAATLTLASPGAVGSLGNSKALVVDGVLPTVSSVTASTANGTYTTGQVINIQVVFSETVYVASTPQLLLATGSPATTTLFYASGSGTNTLLFNYTVTAGNFSADLDYANTTALTLAGGAIGDAAGNNAALTLAAPGTPGSLGNSKNFIIDTGGLVPGAAISFSAISTTGLTVNWGAATDDNTAQVALQYKVVKDNTAIANINTVALADAKSGGDLLQNWTAAATSFPVVGLTAATTYHFAVLVRDGVGNMALYTPASQATSGGGATKRLIIPISGMNTMVYNSATHTIVTGATLSNTPSNGGYSFPLTSGANSGKIFFAIGGGSFSAIHDPVGNSFVTGSTVSGGISGAGGHSFAIPTGPQAGNQLLVKAGSTSTVVYLPGTDTYSAGPALSFTTGAGAHTFAINSGANAGKFFIVHAGGNRYTTLYNPGTNTAAAGPDLFASTLALGVGGHSFPITSGTDAGKILIVHGGTLTSTSLYDPAGTISVGPVLASGVGLGGHAFAITTGIHAGKTLIVHGNTTMTTSLYDPGIAGFIAGPSLPSAVAGGGHSFAINAGVHPGKTLVINGGGTATSLFDPSGTPGFTSGPSTSLAVATGSHSWDMP